MGDRDVPLSELRKLDACGMIRWRFMEQRDWMRRLDAPLVAKMHEEAIAELLRNAPGVSAADRTIAEHVRKDNSYLHGHIVDTNAEEAAAAAAAATAAATVPTSDAQDGAPADGSTGTVPAAAAAGAAVAGAAVGEVSARKPAGESTARADRAARSVDGAPVILADYSDGNAGLQYDGSSKMPNLPKMKKQATAGKVKKPATAGKVKKHRR